MNILSTLYFIAVLLPVMLLIFLMPVFFLIEVGSMRTSGFIEPFPALAIIGFISLFIAISLLIPFFRKAYDVLPWLFPFVKILLTNTLILCTGLAILSYGYEEYNQARHAEYFWYMIAFLFAGRLLMCMYFKWRPAFKASQEVTEHEA